MGKDYYIVLEINRDATDRDIKKAYRRLALKYHPIRSTEADAEQHFFQLAEAYEVLSDLRKKAVYDKFGEEGLKEGVPHFEESGAWTEGYTFHGCPEKTFCNFFGGDNPFSDFFMDDMDEQMKFGGLLGLSVKKQDPPIERELHLALEDLFYGCMKKMKISRRVMNEDGCTSSIRDKILSIEVKPGWGEGMRIVFEKEGDQGPNIIPADIVFVVREKTHSRFSRQHDNLVYKQQVSLAKALTGFSVEVQTLDGRLINIPINDIVHPNYTKVVPGEGMPLSSNPSTKGDLIIQFEIQFPEEIDGSKKKTLKQLLSP